MSSSSESTVDSNKLQPSQNSQPSSSTPSVDHTPSCEPTTAQCCTTCEDENGEGEKTGRGDGVKESDAGGVQESGDGDDENVKEGCGVHRDTGEAMDSSGQLLSSSSPSLPLDPDMVLISSTMSRLSAADPTGKEGTASITVLDTERDRLVTFAPFSLMINVSPYYKYISCLCALF